MTYEARLRESVPRVRDRIEAARARAGRTDEVVILPVTKGHPADAVRAVAAVGLARVGENRVAELESKRAELGDLVEWHMIGHLQRNKVRRALPLFDRLHSVDSPRLAAEVSHEAERLGRTARVYVQVNASGEATKGGIDAAAAPDEVARIAALPGIMVDGLMTMAPLTDDERVLRACFATMRRTLERCAEAAPTIGRGLSMGMSNDYEIAVEEGSTIVRLGTILLGERAK